MEMNFNRPISNMNAIYLWRQPREMAALALISARLNFLLPSRDPLWPTLRRNGSRH